MKDFDALKLALCNLLFAQTSKIPFEPYGVHISFIAGIASCHIVLIPGTHIINFMI
jgi:hypothetical protein